MRTAGLEAEALVWATRMNGRPSRQDRADFTDWLARGPDHAAAWQSVSGTWAAAAGLAAMGQGDAALTAALAHVAKARADAARSASRARLRNLAVAAGIGLLTGGWLWLEHPHLLQDLRADQITARAERREMRLEDGSLLMLDADSAVAFDFTPEARRVILLRGAAWFDVRPEDRPFLVTAADGDARVLGTAFEVTVLGRSVEVVLERGSLRVAQGAAEVTLVPGQGVSYGSAGMGAVRPVAVDEALAWKDGRLVFENARLADVLARIERYLPGRVLVLGAWGEMRVSGSFALDDPMAALRGLEATFDLPLRQIGGRLVVIGP